MRRSVPGRQSEQTLIPKGIYTHANTGFGMDFLRYLEAGAVDPHLSVTGIIGSVWQGGTVKVSSDINFSEDSFQNKKK